MTTQEDDKTDTTVPPFLPVPNEALTPLNFDVVLSAEWIDDQGPSIVL